MNNIQKENINILLNFFKESIKPKSVKTLGFELEHIIVDNKTIKSVTYLKKNGVKDILKKMSFFYSEEILIDNELLGLKRGKSVITLEPAGQLEISIGPLEKIDDFILEYSYFIKTLFPILKELDYSIFYGGYHPKSKIDELSIIPKNRYEYMFDYFKNTGNCGKNMMKGTASTQISIDFYSEEDFIKKFRLANILTPILSFITDNTYIFENELYKDNMLRTKIWNDVDKDRAGVIKDALNKPFSFLDYAEHILNSPAILVMDENDNAVYTKNKKIIDIYKDKLLSKEDVLHILSMFFFDNRLKNYIEIRFADSLDFKYAISYLSLIKGIFYNKNNIDKLLKETEFVKDNDLILAKEALIKNGYDASVYGFKPYDFLKQILDLAKIGLEKEEKEYLDPLFELLNEKTTLKIKKQADYIKNKERYEKAN